MSEKDKEAFRLFGTLVLSDKNAKRTIKHIEKLANKINKANTIFEQIMTEAEKIKPIEIELKVKWGKRRKRKPAKNKRPKDIREA